LVDSNGILPMRATDRVFSRAYDFRRHLQKTITLHLAEAPAAEPFSDRDLPDTADLPAEVTRRWPRADFATAPDQLSDLPIDHSVGPAKLTGGSLAAAERADAFFAQLIGDYDDQRNQPEADASSGLSPYLHFGHISSHETFARACDRDGWSPDKVSDKADGSSSGWWGGGENFEAFMDELITWRELGFNRCALTTDFDRYESLPDWAQKTLAEHEGDTREHVYELDQFERADTHDELWNAAQQQLLQEGKIHNYLRMLWGKKILEWSATPRDALAVMLELNNKYAVDGRDPNSYSGIFWVLGRYDRAWGPERPIFGKIRYMSSKNTAKKVRVKDYVSHYLHGEQTLFS
ncbi:MAG: deoxyribodipyrimidine photolyase, partial [Planctomycetota bacterium]